MPRARPAGFTFLTLCALLCACGMAWALATLGGEEHLPAIRFAVAATGALALVTAEALAFVQPWAYGASLAFAGSFVAMLFVTLGDFSGGIATTALVALPIAIALSIVHNGLASRAATAQGVPRATPVPIPVPRP
jgi:hypothetical protein